MIQLCCEFSSAVVWMAVTQIWHCISCPERGCGEAVRVTGAPGNSWVDPLWEGRGEEL